MTLPLEHNGAAAPDPHLPVGIMTASVGQRHGTAPRGDASQRVARKSRNTMSGALKLWREGIVRPAHSSTASARLKVITGSWRQACAPFWRQPTCATSAL